MTRAEIAAAIKKGHTHAVTVDTVKLRQPVAHRIVSTHKTYAEAARSMRDKGNAVWPLEALLAKIR